MRNIDGIIENLLQKNTDELFIQLGEELELFALNENNFNKKNIGSAWFIANKRKLQNVICKSSFITTVINEGYENEIQIVAGIADLISSYFSNAAIYTLSVLIFKTGISNFCKNVQ